MDNEGVFDPVQQPLSLQTPCTHSLHAYIPPPLRINPLTFAVFLESPPLCSSPPPSQA